MKFKNIIKGSMHHFKKVVKIDHDSSITDITIFEVDNIDSIFDQPLGFSGRGGTSHQEVYKLLEDIYTEENNKYTEKLANYTPSLILFMTDFCSDIQSYHHTCEWVKEIPYKYIVSGNMSENIVPNKIDPKPIYIKD
jgi:hypothetical protein